MSTKPQPEEIPEDQMEEGEIIDDDEEIDDDELMEFEDEVDIASLMTSLLATDEGDTICTALVAIGQQLQTQNRILVKIFSELKG
jgi:hypothetical protein|tara:strand:- start:1883 stop:2137 length:255 start_codon:yes stop_codon:yes gene_type:complete